MKHLSANIGEKNGFGGSGGKEEEGEVDSKVFANLAPPAEETDVDVLPVVSKAGGSPVSVLAAVLAAGPGVSESKEASGEGVYPSVSHADVSASKKVENQSILDPTSQLRAPTQSTALRFIRHKRWSNLS